jgi:BirA family biotin operon repressor/biotin-[acetyl-CoA-carboxylase] ligase
MHRWYAMDMNIFQLDTVNSTNDLAKEYIIKGNVVPAAFVARHQTAGRGRMNRVWEDEPGANLLVSFALPGGSYSDPPLLGMAAATYVGDYLETLQLDWAVKWPNDVLIRGKKVAGILPESIWQGQMMGVVIGIGLNVNQENFSEGLDATSLKIELGRTIDIGEPLAFLSKSMEDVFNGNADYVPVVVRFREKFSLLGQKVIIKSGNEKWEGIAADIEDDGSLLLITNDTVEKIRWGEVTLR